MRRNSVTLLSGSALAVLLGAGPAQALSSETKAGLSPEQVCLATKLEAATRYHRCLTYAFRKTIVKGGTPSDERIARCDRRFDDAFDAAEASADCHTPGGATPVRAAIKEQVLSTFVDVAAIGPCTAVYVEADQATCVLSTSASSIDLEAMLDQINTVLNETRADPPTVDDGTTIWIMAWAGHGGNGADIGGGGNEGNGGDYGYAQTTTTVSAIDAAYGVTQLYYYLGRQGSHASESGGDGGTATFVTAVDATTTADLLPETLLVAGGGGGGGAGNSNGQKGCDLEYGKLGGGGGIAISLGTERTISGNAGQDFPPSGSYGTNTGVGGSSGGGSSTPGDFKFAPVGGAGGGTNTNPSVGFYNQSGVLVTAGGGHGGAPGDGPAPGAGGGGGLAGGGGGAEAVDSFNVANCPSGGGGGGSSLAIASTESCKIAPGSMPTNPNGNSGFVQIGIDLGGC
jgi:hypothetical protein